MRGGAEVVLDNERRYLNGSTINVTYKNNPTRYTGGYVTEDFFRILGRRADSRPRFCRRDNKPGAEKVTLIWARNLAARFQRRSPISLARPVRINGKAATLSA